MEKRLFTIIGICFCLSAFGFNKTSFNRDIPPDTTPIQLHGTLDTNPSSNDVEAYTDPTMVGVNFQKNFGNVSITIYNAMGQVIYSDVVNTAVQQTAIIPFFSVPSSNYRIVLESANGYAEGEFER